MGGRIYRDQKGMVRIPLGGCYSDCSARPQKTGQTVSKSFSPRKSKKALAWKFENLGELSMGCRVVTEPQTLNPK